MIRIAISMPEVNERIAAISRWVNNVDERRQANIAAGRHVGQEKDIWSAVKPVFMHLQLVKCCYCERRLGEYGVEWDVEHYRPKGRLKSWLPPKSFEFRFKDKAGGGGYYLLAYDPLNYLASCKTCNSKFKGEYFPVVRRRRLNSADSLVLAAEQPMLINPLHDDEDPEELIEFLGPTPQPRVKNGIRYKRALVTIEVLGLARGDLMIARCWIIYGVWKAWTTGDEHALNLLCRADAEHAGCARSFRRVCESDEARAEAIYDSALITIEKGQP